MTEPKQAHSGRKRLLVAGGSLLAIGALATVAAFTDFANINLGNGTDDSGIGGKNRFNIQVVQTDDEGNPTTGWQEADTAEGVNFNLKDADLLAPGETVSIEIPFRNESPALSAKLDFSLQDRPGKTSDPVLRDALRYTVTLDGTPVASTQTQDQVNALDLGTFVAGKEGILGLTVELPSQGSPEADNALQAKVSYVQAHFGAISVRP